LLKFSSIPSKDPSKRTKLLAL